MCLVYSNPRIRSKHWNSFQCDVFIRMMTTPWSIQIAWKCFSSHSIRFTNSESDERRDVVKMGWSEYCVIVLSPSLFLPNTDNYFNVYFFPLSFPTLKWAANRNATKNRTSNSKMCLVSFNLQYAFIVLHTKCVCFSLLFRYSCHYQFDIWIEEQWKRNKQKKMLWSYTTHQLPVVVYHQLRCRFFPSL